MRIAYFSDNSYPELSGIVDSIHTTGKELVRRGHEVAYVGPHYPRRAYTMVNRPYTEKNGQEHIDGLPFVRLPSVPLPYSPTGQSQFAFPTGASFRFLDDFKPDIIHTQSPYGTGFEAMRAARRYQKPLVGTNHTAVEEFYPFAPTIMRNFDAWYYNHCTFVTTPYAQLIAQMRKKGFRRPAAPLPNPVELSLFCPPHEGEKAEIKNRMGFRGPVVLYAGRLAVEKRVDVVLRAIAPLCKEFPLLTFVATGHGVEKEKLQKLAHTLEIERNVRFTGFIPMETLAEYYKAADLFVIMSTADSQSIALMQAYATGIPAVCARSRGLPDYTPADCGFLVEPGNYAELRQKVVQLLRDKPLRKLMGRAGLQFVQKFSPARIAGEWERIYKDALSVSSSFSAARSRVRM